MIKMINKTNKIMTSILIMGVFIILSSILVSAEFGVGSPKNIVVLPEQLTKDTALTLQNTLDDAEDVVIMGSILEGAEYISFLNDVNAIEVLGGEVVQVPIRATAPSDSKPGDSYEIKVLFEVVSGGESGDSGMVEFEFNVEKSFNLVVFDEQAGEAPEGISTTWIILGIVFVIIIIVLIWFVVKSKKETGSIKAK